MKRFIFKKGKSPGGDSRGEPERRHIGALKLRWWAGSLLAMILLLAGALPSRAGFGPYDWQDKGNPSFNTEGVYLSVGAFTTGYAAQWLYMSSDLDYVNIYVAVRKPGNDVSVIYLGKSDRLCNASIHVETNAGHDYKIATLGCMVSGDLEDANYTFTELCDNDHKYGHIFSAGSTSVNGIDYNCYRFYPSSLLTMEVCKDLYVEGVWAFSNNYDGHYADNGYDQRVVKCTRGLENSKNDVVYPQGTLSRPVPDSLKFDVSNIPANAGADGRMNYYYFYQNDATYEHLSETCRFTTPGTTSGSYMFVKSYSNRDPLTFYERVLNIVGMNYGYYFESAFEYDLNPITLKGCSYPEKKMVTFNQLNKTVELTWEGVTDGRHQDGKWYIFRYLKSDGEGTRVRLGSVDLSQNSYTDNDSKLVYDKDYVYEVSYQMNNWGIPKVPVSDLKAVFEVSTERNFNISLKLLTTTNTSIKLQWDYPAPNQQTTFYVLRSDNGGDFKQVSSVSVDASSTSSTFEDVDVVSGCMSYEYKIKTTLMGKDFYSSSDPPVKGSLADNSQITKLVTSKGTYSNVVRLSWESIQRGSAATKYVVGRRLLGSSDDFSTLTTLSGTSNEYTYDDVTAAPGQYYEYSVTSYYYCATGGDYSSSASLTSDGFSQSTGIVSGRISYGTGVSVPSAKVNLISGDSTSTKSQFYSMRVDGLGGGVFWKADTITARKYFEGTKPFTVELWARVDRNIMQTENSSKRSWPMLADAADNFSIMVQPDSSDASKYEVVMRTPGAGTTLFEDTHTGIIVNPNQYYHYTLSTNGSGTWTMRVVVGDSLQSKTVTGKRAVKWNTAKPAVSFGTNISNDPTYTMKGFIDDVRIWTKELTNKEVLANYNRILGGAETDLKLYWPFDEGINKQQTAYDYSKTGGVANGNHGQLASGSSVSTVVPSADQLSLYGLTDEYGNYVIRGVPFTGEGTNYIVKPVKGVHAFSPQQSTRFVSSSSLNFSGVDFTDVSSFTVKGVVYYKNTDYPVADANFYVDGTICSKKGVACISDQYGKFEISVPVGDHYIQIKKDGHVFVNNGRYPSDPNNVGTLYTFVDSLSNMTFYDSTLVVVAGRVCGGDIEKAKPLGMGLSTNNVGTATIILTAGSSSPYRLNVDVVKSGTIFRYDNGAGPIEVASPTKDVNSKTTRMSGVNCKLISITTDKNTGEFAALLPPLNYSVSSIKVPGKNSTTVTLSTSDLSTINASSPLKTSTDTFKVAKDTVKVLKDSVKRFTYCASMKKVIYNEPTFEVTQVDAPEGRFGEPSISYRAANMAKPVTILAYDKNGYKFGSPSDTTRYPIFKEFNTYKFKVKAYEQYVNYENNLTTTVPLQNVEVTTVNEMSSIQKVYVDTGTVKSSGQFVKAGDFVTLEDNKFTLDSLGTAVYEWVAGFPNILDPYTRAINMSFVQNKKTYNWKLGNATGLEGIVLGTLPSGNDFVTKGPDKVLMVLRDPPGTGSTASWEAGTTTTSTVTSEGFIDTTIGETAEADLGTELTTIDGTPGFGVITSVKHKESVTASLKTDVKYTGSNTKTYTTTTLRKISTSGEVDFVGAKGDVFVGNATNILFGNERKVGIQKDTEGNYFIGRTDVLTTGSTFGTEFMYTQNYVEQTLLPNLLKVRNSMLIEVTDTANYVNYTDSAVFITMLKPDNPKYGSSNYDKDTWGPDANVNTDQTYGPSYKMVVPKNRPDTTTVYQDKIQWYNLQIATWKQVLANNEMAKVTAIENHDKWFDKNYSIDSGTAFESSVTNDTTTSHTNSTEWNTVISAAYGNETKISGVGVTFTDNVEVNTGGHWSDDTGTTHTTTTSYSIVETGDDDSHTFDVYKAPDGFGAIFVTRGGRTSCPYEGQEVTKYYKPGTEINAATSQIEMPFIKAKNPVITDVPSGTKATFMLQLSNLSETGENVFFDLKPLSTDAKKGASLTLSTGPLGDGHAFLVNAEDTLNVMLQLSQMQTSVLDYDHIGLVLVSQCQKDPTGANKVISDTCYISAHFVPTSSDITLNIDKTTMNMFTSDTLAMSIRDYDANFNGLKAIRIQYKGERDVNWNLAKEYVVNKAYLNEDNELLPSGGIVNFNFPMSNTSTFPDQTYQFRAITVSLYGSENVTKASSTILVVKDMAPPRLLGYAKPTNGILNKGDEISVVFNEAIKGSQLTDANNFIITGVLNESTIAHNVGLKLDGTDRAAYTEADVQLAGKSFAVDTWVNYHGAGTIFSHGHGTSKFTAGTDAEGHLVMNIGGSTYTSAKTIPQNKWVFLTFNYTNDTQCTLNAMTAFDAETVTLFNNEPVVAYTGLGNITVGSKLNGAIQEMTLWDRARSMAEAQGDMYKTKAASTPYLIGYWKFDEGEGVKAADLARSRNMVLPVANWYLNNVNKAVTLDGKSYVALDITACSALATDDYAFEMWFRGKTKAESTLFSVGEKKLSVGFDSSGLLQLISDGAITQLGTNDYLNNAWHHLALNVLRNGNAIVYVDGTAVKQVAASQVEALAGNAINLGAIRYLDGTGTYAYKSYFTGQVDEVRFWKATLSANALRANRLLRLNGKEAGLVAYYPFEKKSLDAANQVVAKGSEVDAVSDSIKAISNAALTYTDEAPSLKVAPTETNVSYSYVASDNSIVLTLNESPAKLEGCTINFTVRNVEDANANVCEPIHWSAYVSQNRLKWENSGTSIKQKSLEETTFTAKITNKGASTENWTLNNLPDWLTADATSGLLPALTDKTITFTVNSSTPIGKYEETIYLSGNDEINEPFTVNLNVTGDEPDWTVNPKAYENSMNVIGQLQIANIPSEDTSDKIAAFIDGECRGVASPVYYPRYDSYYTIMNVYGNGGEKGDAGKTIVFKVWDASTGTIYPFVTTSYAASFTANQVLGSSANPYIWNAQKVVEQDIDLAQGWNWISLFANSTDMTVSTLLSNIKSSTNTIKSKTSFAVPDTGKVWGGELTRLYVGDMYKLKSTKSVVFSMVGEVVKAVDEPVTIHDGWNWIGYNANYNVSVADAFAELSPTDGDQVKDQYDFAVYQGYAWMGTLKVLAPGRGYMYKSAYNQDRLFHYPSKASTSISSAPALEREMSAFTTVSANAYPGNMTMVAKLVNGSTAVSGAEVGVFANDGCRSAEVSNSDGIVFLTIAGEGTGAPLTFKVYNGGKTTELDQGLIYTDDATYGTMSSPYLIQLDPTAIDVASTERVHIYPTRIVNDVKVDAGSAVNIKRIMVQDTGGRILLSRENGLTEHNVIPMSGYADGIYFIVVETSKGNVVKRVLK